ncbi:AAA family ATPase [Sphingomonas canadensis]|uniref:AAA family ATPase n=1 Tax=Sphingomonas canadensis TaxID=1219257 RepID=A0ABW3H9F6_9SPHN|nr:AAA family ATPase [Sphingomonas canadensis]MCW3836000.1 AAA family ATPase [Sphingomonas canadensis]
MTEDEKPHADYIEEQRAWLKTHMAQLALTWPEVASRTGIKQGTISQFGGKNGYGGRELPIAEAVQRYRDLLVARDTVHIDAPEIPDYFETQTSAEIVNLLHWCQRGKMVSAPLGSGLGKSSSAAHFRALYPHIYIVTIWPSHGSPGPMQIRVLAALGVKNATGSPAALSQMICDKLSAMHRPVLIFDEAQHLTVKSLEEIRGIHDETGAGIAFFGDQRLANLIANGTGKSDLPQLRRRVKSMAARVLPYAQDVAALARAWAIDDPRAIRELEQIARKPGALGLATQVLEVAAMLASADKAPIGLPHLQEAAADILRRDVAA